MGIDYRPELTRGYKSSNARSNFYQHMETLGWEHVSHNPCTPKALYMLDSWSEENLDGKFAHYQKDSWFEHTKDLVHFTLKWVE